MPEDAALQAEQEHLDFARSCLHAMRESAAHIADYGVDELASHALGRVRAQRLAALTADPDAPAFFGRIDRDPSDGGAGNSGGAGTGETFHIGRRHVRDAAGDPVVIDWRAPIARAFYRATPSDRMGVRLRRRFGFAANVLTSMEDEHLDRGEELGLASKLLREEIERPRVGPMRDIVATIQPDQDDLVRADLDTSLCVQGGPGTGKTAVGLHRAAYLLYAYPQRLRRSGVLVVGPNQAFLHYIEQVLPSLGEAGIVQATLDELINADVQAVEPDALAILKSDARMADVLRRAVVTHVVKPADDLMVLVGTRRYRVPVQRLRRYVDDARRLLGNGLHWFTARDRLRRQIAEDVRRQREDAGDAATDAETERVARADSTRAWVDSVWPELSAPQLLAQLFADPALLDRCARAVLDEGERAALRRDPVSTGPGWTAADAVLLDELHDLLHGTQTYVHVVLDEAQDLSPMQCRAVARRCPVGSMTVLGDLAQATAAWAPGAWPATLEHLGHPTATIRPLTIGYRVPGEVLDLANRLLPHIAADLRPVTSVRRGDSALTLRPRSALVDTVRGFLAVPGSLGVLVADAAAAELLAELRAGSVPADLLTAEQDIRVTVAPASAAKGLEFDSVVVVDPAAIVAAEPTRQAGLRRLYVVLTRAVSRLAIVSDAELPRELA